MFKIVCRELTGEDCGFVTSSGSSQEAKDAFYAHGAESPLHKERYRNASREDIEAFSKKIDEYLAAQKG